MSTVSVIIPCYNHAHFLSQAVESCLAQTHPPHEIIVVDDGSTDNTREVAISYPQVIYIHQQNSGLAATRNTGLEAATGEFIQFLDADDMLLPAKLARSLELFDQYPSAGLVYTDYEKRSEDMHQAINDRSTRAQGKKPEGKGIVRQLVNSTASYFPPHGPLTRTEPLRAVGGFRRGCQGVEDWLLWVTLAAHGVEFRYLDEALIWYRHSPKSMSNQAVGMTRARLSAYQLLREIPLPTDIDLDEKIAGRHHALAMLLWELGQVEEARQHFQHAIALHPKSRTARRLLLGLSYVTSAQNADKIMEMMLKARP